VLERRQEEMEEFRAALFKREYMPRVQPFPGVPDLFRRLREAGIKVAVASSGKGDEVAAHLRTLGVEHLIDATTTSDDAERSKPFPDIFEAAFRKLGLSDPSEALVVGDTPYDAEAARAGGFSTVGVLCGGFAEGALREAGCVAIFRDPLHILTEFDNSPFATGLG
jgi:HAD superfamily hydrolase (TIGR01509 family)